MFQALIGIISFGYLFWLSYKMICGYISGYKLGLEIGIREENARRADRRASKKSSDDYEELLSCLTGEHQYRSQNTSKSLYELEDGNIVIDVSVK